MDNAGLKREKKKVYKTKVRGLVRLYLQDYKSSRPCRCGENRHYCLVFHHNDPTTKEFELSQSRDKSFTSIVSEVAKCRVMCSNCHLELHYLDDNISRERMEPDELYRQLELFD